MSDSDILSEILTIRESPALHHATLVLALTGWMDGGNVSTGTVQHLVSLLEAPPIAEIDPEPFHIYNIPGSMEVATMFRPHVEISDGLVTKLTLPTNTFYCHAPGNLALFVGAEPNLRWRTFGQCIFRFAREVGVQRIVFVGSFGGPVPHTRLPRLYVSCSDASLLPEMEQYAVRRTGYEGPGSFTNYLLTQAKAVGLDMVSLVAEIPGYLQGTNPASIEAVTRRLVKLLKLPLDLAPLRNASTAWELQVSQVIEENEELAETVRKLEQAYDNELINLDADPS
jgi:proteasome assembly chaperone (PAC2) family protein